MQHKQKLRLPKSSSKIPQGEKDFLLENTIAPALKHVTEIHYECPATKATSQIM